MSSTPTKKRLFSTFTPEKELLNPRKVSENGKSEALIGYSLLPALVSKLSLEALHVLMRNDDSDPLLRQIQSRLCWGWGLFGPQIRNIIESPCFGLPGYSNYLQSRHQYFRKMIATAGFNQAVILGSGFDLLGYQDTGITWYEVDSADILKQKRSIINKILPMAHPRPKAVELNLKTGMKTLIPALTSAGFDPESKSIFILPGLLQRLDTVDSLMLDISCLLRPGSRLVFDAIHDQSSSPGYQSLRQLHESKGASIKFTMKNSFSCAVKFFQPFHFRVVEMVNPSCVGADTNGPVPAYMSFICVVKTNEHLFLKETVEVAKSSPQISSSEGNNRNTVQTVHEPTCILRPFTWLFSPWQRLSASKQDGLQLPAARGAVETRQQHIITMTTPPRSTSQPPLPPQQQQQDNWTIKSTL